MPARGIRLKAGRKRMGNEHGIAPVFVHDVAFLQAEYLALAGQLQGFLDDLFVGIRQDQSALIHDADAGMNFFRITDQRSFHHRLAQGFPVEDDANDADELALGVAPGADAAGVDEDVLSLGQ